MDDRERLLELCRENGIEVHHKTGIAKLQEALDEAGIEYDTPEAPETEAAPEPKPKTQSKMVEVIVLAPNVHVRATDLGRPHSEMSVKLVFKQRVSMLREIAEVRAREGVVEII